MEGVYDGEDGDAGEERLKGGTVSDVYFESVAEEASTFLEHGFEVERSEHDAGQIQGFEGFVGGTCV